MKMTKSITIYDVVLVPFPFTHLKSTKKRPCLVLSRVTPKKISPLYIVAMMTSQVDHLSIPHDVLLDDIQTAGLPKATLVRLSKITTVEESLIEKKIGNLSSKDQMAVKGELRELLKEWF